MYGFFCSIILIYIWIEFYCSKGDVLWRIFIYLQWKMRVWDYLFLICDFWTGAKCWRIIFLGNICSWLWIEIRHQISESTNKTRLENYHSDGTVSYYLGVKGGGLFFQFFDFFLIPNGKVWLENTLLGSEPSFDYL